MFAHAYPQGELNKDCVHGGSDLKKKKNTTTESYWIKDKDRCKKKLKNGATKELCGLNKKPNLKNEQNWMQRTSYIMKNKN